MYEFCLYLHPQSPFHLDSLSHITHTNEWVDRFMDATFTSPLNAHHTKDCHGITTIDVYGTNHLVTDFFGTVYRVLSKNYLEWPVGSQYYLENFLCIYFAAGQTPPTSATHGRSHHD